MGAAVVADAGVGVLHGGEEVGGEGGGEVIDLVGGGEGFLGGGAGWDETPLMDGGNVDGIGVEGRRGEVAIEDAAEEKSGAAVEEGEVGEVGGDGPLVVDDLGKLVVGGGIDELFEAGA